MGSVFHSEVQIRDAVFQDMDRIAQIYNQSILAGDATMDQETKSAGDMRDMWRSEPHGCMLALVHETEILGYGLIKAYSPRKGYRHACEASVYLDRSYVSKGLGTRLMQALFDRARQSGYHHVVGKILATNDASVNYCLALGFEMVGRQKEIGYARGRWLDVIILQKIL